MVYREVAECEGEACLLPGEEGPVGWTDARFDHIIQLRSHNLESMGLGPFNH